MAKVPCLYSGKEQSQPNKWLFLPDIEICQPNYSGGVCLGLNKIQSTEWFYWYEYCQPYKYLSGQVWRKGPLRKCIPFWVWRSASWITLVINVFWEVWAVKTRICTTYLFSNLLNKGRIYRILLYVSGRNTRDCCWALLPHHRQVSINLSRINYF